LNVDARGNAPLLPPSTRLTCACVNGTIVGGDAAGADTDILPGYGRPRASSLGQVAHAAVLDLHGDVLVDEELMWL